MKINAPVKINISELKANVDPSVKVETIKADLKAEGAHVAGYRDEDGTLVMVISTLKLLRLCLMKTLRLISMSLLLMILNLLMQTL